MLKAYLYDRTEEGQVNYLSTAKSLVAVDEELVQSDGEIPNPKRDASKPAIICRFNNNFEVRLRIVLPTKEDTSELIIHLGKEQVVKEDCFTYFYRPTVGICIVCHHPSGLSLLQEDIERDLTAIRSTCPSQELKDLISAFFANCHMRKIKINENQHLSDSKNGHFSSEDSIGENPENLNFLGIAKEVFKRTKSLDKSSCQDIIHHIKSEIQKKTSFEDRLLILYYCGKCFLEKEFLEECETGRQASIVPRKEKLSVWHLKILKIESEEKEETIIKYVIKVKSDQSTDKLQSIFEDQEVLIKIGYIMKEETVFSPIFSYLIDKVNPFFSEEIYKKFAIMLVTCCKGSRNSLQFMARWWKRLSNENHYKPMAQIIDLLNERQFSALKLEYINPKKFNEWHEMFENSVIEKYLNNNERKNFVENYIIPAHTHHQKLAGFYKKLIDKLKYKGFEQLSDEEMEDIMKNPLIQKVEKKGIVEKYIVEKYLAGLQDKKKKDNLMSKFFEFPYPYSVEGDANEYELTDLIQDMDFILNNYSSLKKWKNNLATDAANIRKDKLSDSYELCFEMMKVCEKNLQNSKAAEDTQKTDCTCLFHNMVDLLNVYLQIQPDEGFLKTIEDTTLFKAVILMRDFTATKITNHMTLKDIQEMTKDIDLKKGNETDNKSKQNPLYNFSYMDKFKSCDIKNIPDHIKKQHDEYRKIEAAFNTMKSLITNHHGALEELCKKYQLNQLKDCIKFCLEVEGNRNSMTVKAIVNQEHFKQMKDVKEHKIKSMINLNKFTHSHKYMNDKQGQDLLSIVKINDHISSVEERLKKELDSYVRDGLTYKIFVERLSDMDEKLFEVLDLSADDKSNLINRKKKFKVFDDFIKLSGLTSFTEATQQVEFPPARLMRWLKKESQSVEKTLNAFKSLQTEKDIYAIKYQTMDSIITKDILSNPIVTEINGRLLVALSRCEKLVVFMRETNKDWIKDLQAEGDQESIALSIDLEAAYRQLDFLMDSGKLSGEDIINKIKKLHKEDPPSVERYERLAAKVDYIIDLKQKVNFEQLKIMRCIKTDSVIQFEFDFKSNEKDREEKDFNIYKYDAVFQFEGKKKIVPMHELNDLITKSFILCKVFEIKEFANLNKDLHKELSQFKQFGEHVKNVHSSLMKLYCLGLTHRCITLDVGVLQSIIEKSDAGKYVAIEGGQLRLAFKMEDQAFEKKMGDFVERIKNECREYKERYASIIFDHHPMTYFYGERMYELLLLMKTKKCSRDTINLLEDISYPAPCSAESAVNAIHENREDNVFEAAKTYLSNLFQESLKLTVDTSKKIKEISFMSKELITVVSCVEENKLNKYDVMLKQTLKVDKSRVDQSRTLYCRRDITDIEMMAFISRALTDKMGRIYFLFNIAELSEDMIYVINREIRRKQSNGIPRDRRVGIVIFDDTSERVFKPFNDLFEYANKDNITTFLKSASKADSHHYLAKYLDVLENTLIVTSKIACSGKTSHILKLHKSDAAKIELKGLQHISFAGDVNEEVLLDRLSVLSSIADTQDKYDIWIQLDYLAEFHLHRNMLDSFLFSLVFMRNFLTSKGICCLSKNINKIYIEIGNSYSSQLSEKLDIISCINKWREEEMKNKYNIKFVKSLSSYAVNNLVLDDRPASVASKGCKYLKMLEDYQNHNKADKKPEAAAGPKNHFPKTDVSQKMDIKEMKRLIEKYYQKPNESFSSFDLWIVVLSKLKDDLDICEILDASIYPNSTADFGSVSMLHEETAALILTSANQIALLHGSFIKTQTKMIEWYISYDDINKLKNEEDIEQFKANFFKKLSEDEVVKEEESSSFSNKELYIPIMSKRLFFPVCTTQTLKKMQKGGLQTKFTEEYIKFHQKKFAGLMADSKVPSHQWSLYCLSNCMVEQERSAEKMKELIQGAESFENNKGYSLTEQNYCKLAFMIFKTNLKPTHPLPIIIVGESGCGKTYLSKFLAIQVMSSTEENFIHITLHEGYAESELIHQVALVIKRASNDRERKFWIFLDEFNTTAIQSTAADMMIDRVVLIPSQVSQTNEQVAIPDNVFFIACCNPYKIKTEHVSEDIGLVPPKKSALLSHNVHPIPARLLTLVWNFGSLTEQDEREHIDSMVKVDKILEDPAYKDQPLNAAKINEKIKGLSNLFYRAHQHVRTIEEKSGVSLRDFKRVLTFYRWFLNEINRLHEIIDPVEEAFEEDRNEELVETIKSMKKRNYWFFKSFLCKETAAGICSAMMCYGLRLNGKTAEKSKLMEKVSDWCKEYAGNEAPTPKDVGSTFEDIAKIYIEFIEKDSRKDVTCNTALKENFLAILACYDCKVPLIIVGSPGTSKTLTTNLFIDFIRKKQPNNPVYKKFLPLKVFNYGGSETSKPEGLLRVFNQAKRYYETEMKGWKENKIEPSLPLIFFDELGLAELSKYNPLKAIHQALEDNVGKIPFIAISNWLPDKSKLNRMVCLWRPDLTEADINEFWNMTIEDNFKPKPNVKDFTFENLNLPLAALGSVFIKFRDFQKAVGKANGKYRNYNSKFHGSRDIYGVFKFIFGSLKSIGENHDIRSLDKTSDLMRAKTMNYSILAMIKQSIERNVNGEVYMCFDSYLDKRKSVIEFNDIFLEASAINSTDKKSPQAGPPAKSILGHFTKEFIEAHHLFRMDELADIYQPETQDPVLQEGVVSLTSSEVMKLMYFQSIEEMLPHSIDDDSRKEAISQFVADQGVVDLILDNILNKFFELDKDMIDIDEKSRYLLIRTETDMVEQMLLDIITDKLKEKGKTNLVDFRHASRVMSTDELISEIKTHVSIGSILVMKDMEEIYGGLYDLFNQKFTEGHNKQQSCMLYFGDNKQKVTVHKNFRCIIFKKTSLTLKSSLKADINLPPPFLNRFEKYLPQLSSILMPAQFKLIKTIREQAIEMSDRKSSVMMCLGLDLFTSITANRIDFTNPFFEPISIKDIQKKLVRLATWHLLLNSKIKKTTLDSYKSLKNEASLLQQMKENQETDHKKIILTFTNASYFTDQLIDNNPDAYEMYSQYTSIHMMEDIEEDMKKIKDAAESGGMIAVHFSQKKHFDVLPYIRTIMDKYYDESQTASAKAPATGEDKTNRNSNKFRVLLIVHVSKSEKERQWMSGNHNINFSNGWDVIVLDRVESYFNYSMLMDFYQASVADILLRPQELEEVTIYSMKKKYLHTVLCKLSQTSSDIELCNEIKKLPVDNNSKRVIDKICSTIYEVVKKVQEESKDLFLQMTYNEDYREMSEIVLSTFMRVVQKITNYTKLLNRINDECSNLPYTVSKCLSAESEKEKEFYYLRLCRACDAAIEEELGVFDESKQVRVKPKKLKKLGQISLTYAFEKEIYVKITNSKQFDSTRINNAFKLIEQLSVNKKEESDGIVSELLSKMQHHVLKNISNLFQSLRKQKGYELIPKNNKFLKNFVIDFISVAFSFQNYGNRSRQHLDALFQLIESSLCNTHFDFPDDIHENDSKSKDFPVFAKSLTLFRLLPHVMPKLLDAIEGGIEKVNKENVSISSKLMYDYPHLHKIHLKSLSSVKKPTINSNVESIFAYLLENVSTNDSTWRLLNLMTYKDGNELVRAIEKFKSLESAADIDAMKLDLFKQLISGGINEINIHMVNRVVVESIRDSNFDIIKLINFKPLSKPYKMVLLNTLAKQIATVIHLPILHINQLREHIDDNDCVSPDFRSIDNLIRYIMKVGEIETVTIFNDVFLEICKLLERSESSKLKSKECIKFVITNIKRCADIASLRTLIVSLYTRIALQLKIDEDTDDLIKADIGDRDLIDYLSSVESSFVYSYLIRYLDKEALSRCLPKINRLHLELKPADPIEDMCAAMEGEEYNRIYADIKASISENNLQSLQEAIQQDKYMAAIALMKMHLSTIGKGQEHQQILDMLSAINTSDDRYLTFISNTMRHTIILNSAYMPGDEPLKLFCCIYLIGIVSIIDGYYSLEQSYHAIHKPFVNKDLSLNNLLSVEYFIACRIDSSQYCEYWGGQLKKNMGIYRCPCNYMYNLDDCGYAMRIVKCPICKENIGGGDHKHLDRVTHYPDYKSIDRGIADYVKTLTDKYNPHPKISKISNEYRLVRLLDLSMEKIVDSRKEIETAPDLNNHFNRTALLHLFDHLALLSLYITNPNNEVMEKELHESITKDPECLDGGKVKSGIDYLLMHVKNDAEFIAKFAGIIQKEDVLICIQLLIHQLHLNIKEKKFSGNHSVDVSMFTDLRSKISIQKEIQVKQRDSNNVRLIQYNKFFEGGQDTLNMSDNSKKLRAFLESTTKNYERKTEAIKKRFQDKNLSGYELLKGIKQYPILLQQYGDMLTALKELIQYVYNKYNKKITFQTADSTLMANAIQKDGVLKELYECYCQQWTEARIGDLMDAVDNFAQGCQENLDIGPLVINSIDPSISTLSMFMIIPEFEDGRSKFFIRSLMQTIVNKIHNPFVDKIRHVLRDYRSFLQNVDPEKAEQTKTPDTAFDVKKWDQCGSEHYINLKDIDIDSLVVQYSGYQSMAEDGQPEGEYLLYLHQLEYDLSLKLHRHKILAETTDFDAIVLLDDQKNIKEDLVEDFLAIFDKSRKEFLTDYLNSIDGDVDLMRSRYVLFFGIAEYIHLFVSTEGNENKLISDLIPEDGEAEENDLLKRINDHKADSNIDDIMCCDLGYLLKTIREADYKEFYKQYACKPIGDLSELLPLVKIAALRPSLCAVLEEITDQITRFYPIHSLMSLPIVSNKVIKGYLSEPKVAELGLNTIAIETMGFEMTEEFRLLLERNPAV